MSELFYKSNLRPSSSERDWWPNWFSWAYFYSNLILYAKPQRQIPSREIDKPTFSPIKIHSQLDFALSAESAWLRLLWADNNKGGGGLSAGRLTILVHPRLFWHNITSQVDYIDFRECENVLRTRSSYSTHARPFILPSSFVCLLNEPGSITTLDDHVRL